NAHDYCVWIGTQRWHTARVVRPSTSLFTLLARVGPTTPTHFPSADRPVQVPSLDCVFRYGSRITSTYDNLYIIRKRPDFQAKPLDSDEDASVHFELDHAGSARSDTKDARIRAWEMLYQYVREPLSSVESVRPSKARVE